MIAVTDHAVLRYLERVYGLDIGAVRAEMLRLAAPAAEKARTGGLPRTLTVRSAKIGFLVVGGRIVTVPPPGRIMAHSGLRRAEP